MTLTQEQSAAAAAEFDATVGPLFGRSKSSSSSSSPQSAGSGPSRMSKRAPREEPAPVAPQGVSADTWQAILAQSKDATIIVVPVSDSLTYWMSVTDRVHADSAAIIKLLTFERLKALPKEGTYVKPGHIAVHQNNHGPAGFGRVTLTKNRADDVQLEIKTYDDLGQFVGDRPATRITKWIRTEPFVNSKTRPLVFVVTSAPSTSAEFGGQELVKFGWRPFKFQDAPFEQGTRASLDVADEDDDDFY